MSQRLKQLALTLVLTLPLVVTGFMAGPFATTTTAQTGQRMVGPRFPVLIDTNGDGRPGAGDAPTGTQIVGSDGLIVSTPVTCDSQASTQLTFSGSDAGRFTTVSRTSVGRSQSLSVSGSGGAVATRLQFTERSGSSTTEQAVGNVVDGNGDGFVESVAVGGTVNTMLTLVFSPDRQYVSIPASQAAIIGARGDTCAMIPQIWAPMADTNADGIGETIVFDLDGNGQADPQLFRSPPLGAPGVPATNTVGLLILTMVLGGIGLWYLGQRRNGAATV